MKLFFAFFRKNNFLIILVFLCLIYLALAFKNPFKENSLIPNLEPSPDVFYYSVPAWNLVRGNGFKMMAFGKEINSIVPPVYSVYLVPFFLIFNDVRCYYFANLLLCFLSIFLFLKLIEVFFGKEKWFLKFALGLILITNFYFYNLPTLLMAENILIPFTLLAVILMFSKFNLKNIILSLITMGILVFIKISSFPVLLVFGGMFLFRIIKTKFWLKISKRLGWPLGILFFLIISIAFVKIALPGIKTLSLVSNNFSVKFISKTLPIYLKEFVGIDGSYLWFNNQQIERWLGIFCLIGAFLGLFLKKYRKNVLILISIILLVTVFHSMMSYPEGRYISTVIPLFILFAGIILDKLKYSFWIILFLAVYFLMRGTVNNFYERKATSLKRQILNNQLEKNETPWSYRAVQNFNEYFKDKKNVYLGTVTNPFYLMYFKSENYSFLPMSLNQEFSGVDKNFIEKYFEKDKTPAELYKNLLMEGKELYVTNYYLTYYHGNLNDDFYNLEKLFRFTQVKDGCLGECKIYKLELKVIK